jgi:hypothetical protein
MPKESKNRKSDVPFVIQKSGEEWRGTIKPTLHVLGEMLFDSWPAAPKLTSKQPKWEESKSSKPLRLGAGYQITIVDENGHERDVRARKRKVRGSAIPDAEIVEEIKDPCSTCGGSGRLGQVGHEVPCPVCQ